MCSYGVRNVLNIDRVQMLLIKGALDEALRVEVVRVARDEYVYVAHNFENIETLQYTG